MGHSGFVLEGNCRRIATHGDVTAIVCIREDTSFIRGQRFPHTREDSSSKAEVKWADFRNIGKVELTGIADGLVLSREREDDPRIIIWNQG